MAGFLIIFSLTMLIQFVSFLLFNIGLLLDKNSDENSITYKQLVAGEKA